MISLGKFRARLLDEEVDDLVDEIFIKSGSAHVTDATRSQIQDKVQSGFSLSSSDLRLYITGSAHLGFSLVEKSPLARYRSFSANSDIDCAIVSARLYSRIWDEIAIHAHQLSPWPHPMNGLGTYMIYGWLRPDKFPHRYNCDHWWSLFNELSRRRIAGMHKVNGALFYSTAHLKRYIARAVGECQTLERLL